MTDQRDTAMLEAVEGTSAAQPSSLPVSRRELLRGAAFTVPTILTLSSGAALANSSNLMIGGSRGSNNTGTQGTPGYFVCVATTTGQTQGNYQLLDGNPGTGIPVGKQFKYKDQFGNVSWVYGDDACALGGDFKYNGTTYNIQRGMLLSAAAYSSLSAGQVIDIKFLNL